MSVPFIHHPAAPIIMARLSTIAPYSPVFDLCQGLPELSLTKNIRRYCTALTMLAEEAAEMPEHLNAFVYAWDHIMRSAVQLLPENAVKKLFNKLAKQEKVRRFVVPPPVIDLARTGIDCDKFLAKFQGDFDNVANEVAAILECISGHEEFVGVARTELGAGVMAVSLNKPGYTGVICEWLLAPEYSELTGTAKIPVGEKNNTSGVFIVHMNGKCYWRHIQLGSDHTA